MSRYVAVLMVGMLTAGLFVGSVVVAAKKETKSLTISDVMKKGHKGKTALVKKVLKGQASAAEKAELVKLYKAMAKLKPPKGDAKSWKKLCDRLIAAAESVAAGKGGSSAALKKAVNCKACHDVHK